MTLRILCMIVALVLAGCNRDGSDSIIPPAVALNSDAMGVFCGMNVLEHPGPKGQIITKMRHVTGHVLRLEIAQVLA